MRGDTEYIRLAIGIAAESRAGGNHPFGALLVGHPDGDARQASDPLRFAGGVGTGFTQRRLEELLARLRALVTDECPFDPLPPREYRRDATWVRPELRARVEIAEFTNEGLVRHASFIELVERR